MKFTGVTARGIITPIFMRGDDLSAGIVDSIVAASQGEGFALNDGDVVGITEAVVARAQGNYATCHQITRDIKDKFGTGPLGVVFPIMSRNRFALLLKAMAAAADKLYVLFCYPTDEMGNRFIDQEAFDNAGINPYSDSFTYEEFREIFPGEETIHHYTKIDYIEFYKGLADNIEILFSNRPEHILKYTKNVLNCDVHSRFSTQRRLKKAGAKVSYRLDQILTASVDGSGYNPEYGLLGSNMATDDSVKLFPRDTMTVVRGVADRILSVTGKKMEVLVYGDGGFKDPVGGIWELADPVISPAFTEGLAGTPKELKMKYFADAEFSDLTGEQLSAALKEKIRNKCDDSDLSLGTTPRQLTDLLGSLCDLVSGSGDKGTPVVLVQGYFSNYASL